MIQPARIVSMAVIAVGVTATALLLATDRHNLQGLGRTGSMAPIPQVEGKVLREQLATAASDSAAFASPVAVDAARTAPAAPAHRDFAAPVTMIIRVGYASVLVDSLETAVANVAQLARQLGGYVESTEMQSGATQIRSASLTIKIPATRYDEALGSLRPLGKVETVNSSSEDVGEEYVDVEARMQNGRRLEERLIGLLATRTGKLNDVLAVERELARVREEVERSEARLRFLRERTAMSTLTVTVHEAPPLIGQNPSSNVIVAALKSAWRNFVALLAAVIASLGWIIPLTGLAAGAAILIRRLAPRLVQPPPRAESGESPVS